MIKKKVAPKIIKILEAFAKMTETERAILVRRYGSIPELKQSEVAKLFNLSSERVRQLEEKAIKLLEEVI